MKQCETLLTLQQLNDTTSVGSVAFSAKVIFQRMGPILVIKTKMIKSSDVFTLGNRELRRVSFLFVNFGLVYIY